MKTIREYAMEVGHEIVGKLTRRHDWEYSENFFGEKKHSGYKCYSDEGGNAYSIGNGGVSITTVDGDVL